MKRFPVLSLMLAGFLVSACGARTGVRGHGGPGTHDGETDPGEPPEAICPEEAWASPGKPAVLYGEGEDDLGIVEWKWATTAAPAGSVAVPSPAHSKITSFDPDVVGDFTIGLTVIDGDGLSDSCEATVHSVVGPPIAFCPEDMVVEEDHPVDLHGDGYDDHWLESFLWEIVTSAPGSTAALEFADRPDARITPDVTGTYRIRFTVTDDEGLTGSCEFNVLAGGVPNPICPEDQTVPTRTTVTLHGDAVDDGTIVAWQWEVIARDTDTAPTLGSPGAQDTTFWALRVGHYDMRMTVVDNTSLSAYCEFRITTTPTGPTAICPPDIETTPLTEVELVGDGEDDGVIVGWSWEVVSRPTGSSAPGPSPATAQIATFMPDVAGEYRMRLTVRDDDGGTGACEFSVLATPSEGLRIELYWNPPESPSDPTDIDLHLLHPEAGAWFDSSWDCFYTNCNSSVGYVLEWDVPSYVPDNPRLDIDDTQGYGPENINIDKPVAGNTYEVGVHYFADDGYGATQAYVKIYCGTISIDPVFEIGPRTIRPTGGTWETNDFWKVASVYWDGYSCEVETIDRIVIANEAMASR